jgi:hypothetical protein
LLAIIAAIIGVVLIAGITAIVLVVVKNKLKNIREGI